MMMMNRVRKLFGLTALVLLASTIPALGQSSGLQLPVTGSNNFSGTASINRFANQGGQIVALGTVTNSTKTAIAAVSWQVTLSAQSNGVAALSCPTPQAGHAVPAVWSPTRQSARLVRVQTSSSCGVLNLSLGATSVNIAGAQVSLSPITLDVSGQSGTPVGGIVCSLLSLVSSVGGVVGDVANVVNLLNSLLGSLTGSLGGTTGGLVGGV